MHELKRSSVEARLSSTPELKTLRFSGRDGCDDLVGSPQVTGRDGYPSPAPDTSMYATHADWGSPAYAYKSGDVSGDVRIDIPEGLDETGMRTRMMRRRTRKLQYTRRISARINNQRDMIWQENPDRVLSYRPSHLHYYGWIPFFIRRNIKATVFANQKLHLQTLCLLLWVALIHATGLGLSERDLAGFVKMFNMSFQGAIFNLGTVVIFILGLFISLVINRWWAIRLAYVKLSSNTMDLCMIIANSVRNEWNWNDQSTQRARSELTRLLNLGHLLVITQADGQSKNFKKSKHCKHIISSIIGAVPKHSKEKRIVVKHISRTWVKKARDINFVDFANEGLVNVDEWNSINDAESKGLPKHLCVYYWTQALIYKCKGADWIVSGQQILPLMLSKISNIVEASAHIFTNISSQMPYPYVHLVSFVVHMYLVALATWYGCFLNVGIDGVENSVDDWRAQRAEDRHMWNKEATIAWCYLLMAVANVTFQGLLDMHSLLDNPFGSHCTKFPLRAQVTDVINTTRTMLTHADVMPAAFRDVFQIQPTTAGSEVSSHDHQLPESGNKFANFLNPPSLHEGSLRVDRSRPTSGPSRRSTEKPLMKRSSLQIVTTHGDIKDTLSQHSAPSGGDYAREKKCVSFSPGSGVSHNEWDEENGPNAASPSSKNSPKVVESPSRNDVVVQDISKETEPVWGDDDTAPESVASLCKGVNVHNQLVFGNLQLSRTVSGDPAIQELYLQRVVADAIKSSRGSLGTMGEENTP
ncbi:hypothetical protein BSKO_06551 [Bryopsis sp. KO-2023]|nr:hypothetical protein BSKO_06551 [Bryopsis sp. KO-2023]